MMKRIAVVVVLAVFLFVGCQAPPVQPAMPGPEVAAKQVRKIVPVSNLDGRVDRPRRAPGIDYIFYPDEPMKHAYRDPTIKPALKADDYDDTRWMQPDRYAITEASPREKRPMVEWEAMTSVVMQYPGGYSGYDNVTNTFLYIAKHSATVAEVWFIVDGQWAINVLTSRLLDIGMAQADIDAKVKFLVQPIDSIWFIDSGPMPIVDDVEGSFAFTDFRYYHERALDDGISTYLGRALPELGQPGPAATYRMGLNMEGGAFQATTDGVCVTGNRQLFNMSCEGGPCNHDLRFMPLAEANAHPLTDELRDMWAEYMGCKDVIITNSITDDGTGHIDMYMKIMDDQRIMVGEYLPPWDPDATDGDGDTNLQEFNAKRMDDNADYLEAYTKADGTQFIVERLIMPGHRYTNEGGLPFTYINSTLINGLNLWPAFTYPEWVESRDVAQQQWDAALPDYENIWIDSEEISYWSGAIHCITRTVPALDPGPWVDDGACDDETDTCTATDGYTGECQPNDLLIDICWGPEWMCTCNDCDTLCDYNPSTSTDKCFGLTYEGCCKPDNSLVYCDGGGLKGGDCDSCGWDLENGWYDCGFEGADPSGAFPYSCEEAMAECTPNCEGKQCGSDGCDGSCGACAPGEACSAEGQCAAPCEDSCTAGETGCSDDVAWTCIDGPDGCTVSLEQDCTTDEKACHLGLCMDPAHVPSPPDADAGATDTGTGDAGSTGGGGGGGGGGGLGCQGGGGSHGLIATILALFGLLVTRRRRRCQAG